MKKTAIALMFGVCACMGVNACSSSRSREAERVGAARQAVVTTYPLRVAPGGRYLEDQSGSPVLLQGDTAWSLFASLNDSETTIYLDDRQARGFNTLVASLIEAKFAPSAPADRYGNQPFSGAAFQSAPNEAYFSRADSVIASAAARGIQFLLAPLYLGYECGDQGWCQQVQAASTEQMREYGRFIGQRYASTPNLIWVIGGDTDPSPVRGKVTAFVEGLREYDTVHLATPHSAPDAIASDSWPSNTFWLDVNSTYAYSTTLWQYGQAAYSNSPTRPFFHFEAAYENEHSVSQQALRAESYFPMLTGGMGAVFGNCPIWNFGTSFGFCDNGSVTWQQALSLQGSVSQTHFGRLFRSRAWQTLVPDQSVLTAGTGSGASLVVSERASNGETVIAYIPTPRSITVDMGKITAVTARAWWYDPATGAATLIGDFAASGMHVFASYGSSDSVLVLDDASREFPAPGTTSGSGGSGGSGTGGSGTGGTSTGGSETGGTSTGGSETGGTSTGGTSTGGTSTGGSGTGGTSTGGTSTGGSGTGGTSTGGSGTGGSGTGGTPGITIGSSNVTSTDTNEQGYLTCGRFQPSGTGSLTTMQLYASPGAGKATMAIYSEVSSKPSVLLGKTFELTTTATGWNSAILQTPVSVSLGVNYWLCARVSSSAFGMGYSSGGTLRWKNASYSTSWPKPLTGMNSSNSLKFAIRASSP